MEEDYTASSSTKKVGKQHNTLPLWGNEASMNLNPLILANIQGSSYFKVHLFKLKTYHEVVDEIYYQVKHMEPWERGSRKTSGQTGMCGGVRGVGAGGIVSTAYCLLYKLYTLRLTRKQVNGLLNHTDSPYIRALGFMYLRYTQPPADLYDWYEDYLQDEEEIDVKAGGGQVVTIGQMVYQFMTKLDWFTTLFPRIPVPIQKQIEKKIEQYCRENKINANQLGGAVPAVSVPTPLPPVSHYRNEHDVRDYHPSTAAASSSSRRREDSVTQPDKDYSGERDQRVTRQHDRHLSKHKKKHKHRHHRSSRSRSRSRSHSRYENKRERVRESERDYRDRGRERDREKERDQERRHQACYDDRRY